MSPKATRVTTIGVVGSPNFYRLDIVRDWINELQGNVTLVTAGNGRVDGVVERTARERGLTCLPCHPNDGTGAPRSRSLRDESLAHRCDAVMAFWDGENREPLMTIEAAKKRGKQTSVINLADWSSL